MSTTITIEGGLYFNTDKRASVCGSTYRFFSGSLEAFSDYIPICKHTLIAELPEGFDPRPAQIKALEAQREELKAKVAAAVTEINGRINSLLAIENETPAEIIAELAE